MNRFLMLSCSAALLAGCASGALRQPTATDSEIAGQKAAQPAHCLTETGSRIKPSAEHRCLAGPGQAYTREDIDRTGATTTTEALRRLSPAAH